MRKKEGAGTRIDRKLIYSYLISASVPYRAKPHLRHRGLVEIQLQLFYELRKVSSVETDGVLGDAVHLHRAAAVDGFQNA